MSLLDFAVHYVRSWRVAVAYQSPSGTPLHEWRVYAERGMTVEEAVRLYGRLRPRRISILTGPYQKERPEAMVIIDVDRPPAATREEKDTLMKRLARDYTVVETPRGFHVHAFVTDEKPYIITFHGGPERRTIAEGGCLYPHPWTSPPSARPVGEGSWFVYRFVLPDGTKTAKYSRRVVEKVEPPRTSLKSLLDDLTALLDAEPRIYKPAAGPAPADLRGEEGGAKRTPLFKNLSEFLAHAGTVVLPRCVAWVVSRYLAETGDERAAASILAMDMQPEELMRPVPHGARFLVSAAAALFIAHVVEDVTFDEITSVLAAAVEDWPEDEGQPLDYKLKYLFYADEEGRVYPRYSGLGALSPLPVLGDQFCSKCPYWRSCRGRNPWRPFTRLYHSLERARRYYDYAELEYGDPATPAHTGRT